MHRRMNSSFPQARGKLISSAAGTVMHADFDPEEARRILSRIAGECKIMAPAPSAPDTASASLALGADSTASTDRRAPELASPVCHLPEFEDW